MSLSCVTLVGSERHRPLPESPERKDLQGLFPHAQAPFGLELGLASSKSGLGPGQELETVQAASRRSTPIGVASSGFSMVQDRSPDAKKFLERSMSFVPSHASHCECLAILALQVPEPPILKL